jgi:hypothetical protein
VTTENNTITEALALAEIAMTEGENHITLHKEESK